MQKLLSTMGCLCSRGPHEDGNPRTFKVINVDDRGQERNPGRIEITDSELVWYQRGREAIRWPLKSLRRYGFDAELFSFESGRRCPTGPGIYAFKCRRAEALFNLLQESIQRQRTGQDDTPGAAASPVVSIPHHAQTRSGPMDNSASVITVTRASRPSSAELNTDTLVPNGSATSPLYVNGDIHRHEYINTEIQQGVSRQNSLGDPTGVTVLVPPAPADHVIQYAELDLPKVEEGGVSDSPTPTHHAPNGHGPGQTPDNLHLHANSQQVMYINVPANEIKKKTISNGKPAGGALTRQFSRDDAPRLGSVKPQSNGTKVNYIQLDHGEGSMTGLNTLSGATGGILATPESPTRTKTDTYARIDLERTRALNQRRVSVDNECSRKTRHNSNIEELYGGDTNG